MRDFFFAEQWADSIDGKSLNIAIKPKAKQRTNADVEAVANIANNFNNSDIPLRHRFTFLTVSSIKTFLLRIAEEFDG